MEQKRLILNSKVEKLKEKTEELNSKILLLDEREQSIEQLE